MLYDGGTVSDVVLSDLVIECTRRDWFWWGDGEPFYFDVRPRSELDERLRRPDEPPAGAIHDVTIRGVIARGTGGCVFAGHATRPLERLTIDGLELHLACDPRAPYERTEHAVTLRNARDVTMRGLRVHWEEPRSPTWRSALSVAAVEELLVDGFRGAPADPAAPAVALRDVAGVLLRGCRAVDGTGEFLHVSGASSRDVQLLANDLRAAQRSFGTDADATGAVRSLGDLLRVP